MRGQIRVKLGVLRSYVYVQRGTGKLEVEKQETIHLSGFTCLRLPQGTRPVPPV